MASNEPSGSTPADGDPTSSGTDPAAGRGRRRALLLAAAFISVVVLVIAGIAIRSNGSSPSTSQAAGATLSDDELTELDSLLPDLPDAPDQPERLQLGRQLLDAGDYEGAMEQYLAVLDEGPNAEALAFVGFITNSSGDPALAQHLLEQSLALDPEYLTAMWFLANVKFFGAGDVAGAVPLLEQIVARTDAEPDMVDGARRMLAAAAELEVPPATTQP